MNPFAFVNEVAVISTAFLMLAVSTVWYASAFFGTTSNENKPRRSPVLIAVVRVVAYGVSLFALASIAAYRELLDLSLLQIALLACLFAVPLLGVGTFAEGRPARMVFADALFVIMFIVVGLHVIIFWPW